MKVAVTDELESKTPSRMMTSSIVRSPEVTSLTSHVTLTSSDNQRLFKKIIKCQINAPGKLVSFI